MATMLDKLLATLGRERSSGQQFSDMVERSRVQSILEQHKSKNFVQRILDPANSPYLDLGGGTVASHAMAWGDDGKGHYYVYPTVLQEPGAKNLKRLSGAEADKYAKKTGELIRFNNAAEADWFSKRYKLVWDK